MTPYEIIARKRDGKTLGRSEITFFVRGYNNGDIPDYQMAALLMAVYFQGMDEQETRDLTDAFIGTGTVIDLSGLPGPKADKHSTGGVGDKVSIILAPVVAAAGVYVPMISGRGLGHTGGTLDKLESIPGFRIDFPVARFRQILHETGACLIGQTAELAPVDKKVYALRDVTATVPSIPLIAASIMSKKIASGIDSLVLDIKVGRGAFMKDRSAARRLARVLIRIGTEYGKNTMALLTAMDQPLGFAVGNWLEIRECIACLHDSGPPDLMAVTCRLAGIMLYQAGRAPDPAAGAKNAAELIKGGAAWTKFLEIVRAQEGDVRYVEQPEKYPAPRHSREITAGRPGWIAAVNALEVGLTAVGLGAGRMKTTDAIDPQAGILLKAKTGDFVEKGQPLAHLYTGLPDVLDGAARRIEDAFVLADEKPAARPLILDTIRRR